jgi:bifunctional non-homologous end joining protein LigD
VKPVPMLCETADELFLDQYLTSDDWWMEQKLDGHRVMIQIHYGEPTPFNRNGNLFKQSMNPMVLDDFRDPRFSGTWIFDGELLNRHYYVFDVMAVSNLGKDMDLRNVPFCTRRTFLDGLFDRWAPMHTDLVGLVRTEHGKRDMLARIEQAQGEGVILKHRDGLYYPGRRSHHMLKHKFVDTADVVIEEVWREGKRSVGLYAYDRGTKVPVGSCTMTERNLSRVQVGDVIEVKYLYRGAGGRLFQPRFVRLRNDKSAIECTVDQFKDVNKEIIT